LPQDFLLITGTKEKTSNMEVIIKFLDEDAAEDARVALDGWKWKHAMWELDQHLRNELKYNEKLPSAVDEAYESLRNKIREILSDNNLTME
jgi:hypothetical protein